MAALLKFNSKTIWLKIQIHASQSSGLLKYLLGDSFRCRYVLPMINELHMPLNTRTRSFFPPRRLLHFRWDRISIFGEQVSPNKDYEQIRPPEEFYSWMHKVLMSGVCHCCPDAIVVLKACILWSLTLEFGLLLDVRNWFTDNFLTLPVFDILGWLVFCK